MFARRRFVESGRGGREKTASLPRTWSSLGGMFVTQFNPGSLANELHDGVVQELSALLLQLETYQRRLESDPDGARADLDRIKAQARETLKSLRQVIAHLREMESG